MKLIIAGGRKFADEALLLDFINDLLGKQIIPAISEIVCGGAKGADTIGAAIGEANGITIAPFIPDWKDLSAEPCVVKCNQYGEYNALAGMVRNNQMGDYADVLVAAWDGKSRGTKQMIDYMLKLGKPAYVLRYE